MNDKASKVIDSPNVLDYKLPAKLRRVFAEFEALKNYTVAVCGKAAPKFVRLPKEHYSDLCDQIRTKSDKRRNIHDVRYNGLPIINELEAAP